MRTSEGDCGRRRMGTALVPRPRYGDYVPREPFVGLVPCDDRVRPLTRGVRDCVAQAEMRKIQRGSHSSHLQASATALKVRAHESQPPSRRHGQHTKKLTTNRSGLLAARARTMPVRQCDRGAAREEGYRSLWRSKKSSSLTLFKRLR